MPKKPSNINSLGVPFDPPPAHGIPSTLTDGLPIPKLFAFDLDYTLWPFWVDTHVTPPLKATKNPDGSSTVHDRQKSHWHFYQDVPAILSLLNSHPQKPLICVASRTPVPELAREMLRRLTVLHPLPAGSASSATLPSTSGKHKDSSTSTSPKKGKTPTSPTATTTTATTSLTTTSSPKYTPSISLFHHLEIYPGSKLTHFRRIHTWCLSPDNPNTPSSLSEDDPIPYTSMLFFDDERRNREVERELGVMMILVRDGVTASVIDEGVRSWRKKMRITKGGEEGSGGSEAVVSDGEDENAWYYSD